jgi:hypothetical protein
MTDKKEKKSLDKTTITISLGVVVAIVLFIFTTTWKLSAKMNDIDTTLLFLLDKDLKNDEDHKVFYKYQNDTNLTLLSIDLRLKAIEESSTANSGLLSKIYTELKELNDEKQD